MLSIGGTTTLLLVGTHINELDACEVEFETCSHTAQTVWVAKQDRIADTLGLCLNGSLHHGVVFALGKYYALWVFGSSSMDGACELSFLTKQLA